MPILRIIAPIPKEPTGEGAISFSQKSIDGSRSIYNIPIELFGRIEKMLVFDCLSESDGQDFQDVQDKKLTHRKDGKSISLAACRRASSRARTTLPLPPDTDHCFLI